ncbi:MAG: response regulator [bacterium]
MSKRILIVDDEADITIYLETVLKVNGFTPVVVNDVHAAQKIIDKSPPDLISLDIMMPKESGLTLYQNLKNNPKTKKIPIIIVSGMGQEGKFDFYSFINDKSMTEPESFMEKPIDVDAYIKNINMLISGVKK